MDAIEFFRLRYAEVHRQLFDDLMDRLPPPQLRARPAPEVNTIAWILWHAARIEDVTVNRFIVDRPQVFEDGWMARLGVERRDVGTGMTDAEVDELSVDIDLAALRAYWEAVTHRTLEVAETLRGADLTAIVPADRVKRVAFSEGAVADRAAWLTEFWGGGRSRGWILAQTPLLHVYGHYFEARTVAGLWGVRSR